MKIRTYLNSRKEAVLSFEFEDGYRASVAFPADIKKRQDFLPIFASSIDMIRNDIKNDNTTDTA